MTQTIEQTETTDTSTPEQQAHMVSCPPDQPSTAVWLTIARAQRLTVEALCGFQFVPERDPKKYRVCAACTDEAGIRIFEGGS